MGTPVALDYGNGPVPMSLGIPNGIAGTHLIGLAPSLGWDRRLAWPGGGTVEIGSEPRRLETAFISQDQRLPDAVDALSGT